MSIEEFIIQDEKLARIAAGKNLQQIEKVFQKYISKVISLYQNFNGVVSPQLKKEIEKLTKQLAIDLENKINSATKEQWMLAQGTATRFVETYFDINKLNKATQDIFRNNNLENYMQARKSRLNQFKLSDRVWKYSKNFETNIIDSLEIALKNGDSAQVLARDIKQYLNEPEKLFRRVRDVKGQLHLSKNAQAYNPGQGVYRSAHKNALRLASNEINTFYKESENQRWKSMDFVVGFEIKRSNNVYDCDLCDSLKGRYPKSFLFTGWHPNCRCYQIPILKPIEVFTDELKGAVKPSYSHLGNFQTTEIKEMPASYKNHLKEKADIYKGYKTVPYWVNLQ